MTKMTSSAMREARAVAKYVAGQLPNGPIAGIFRPYGSNVVSEDLLLAVHLILSMSRADVRALLEPATPTPVAEAQLRDVGARPLSIPGMFYTVEYGSDPYRDGFRVSEPHPRAPHADLRLVSWTLMTTPYAKFLCVWKSRAPELRAVWDAMRVEHIASEVDA